MYPLLENWQWTSWKQRIWRKWMLVAYQVIKPLINILSDICLSHCKNCLLQSHKEVKWLHKTQLYHHLFLFHKIRMWRLFCSKMGNGLRRKRQQSRKTPSILTLMRVSASMSPSSRYRCAVSSYQLSVWNVTDTKCWWGEWFDNTYLLFLSESAGRHHSVWLR